jgi:hypothetical protein
MSERVSNQLARAVADGHDAAAVGRIELALDLLDSRARVKELEGAARECLSLIDKDASTHARPTTRAVFAVQGILRRVLSGEE